MEVQQVGSRSHLLDFDGMPEFGRFVCEHAGLRCVVGEKQDWAVGAHRLRVEVALDRDRVIYVVWVRSGWPPKLKKRTAPLILAEVYGIGITENVAYFNSPTLSYFKHRALLEAGLLDKPRVQLAELPDGAPASAVATWDLIGDLAVVRKASGQPLDETPLSAPQLARWYGIGDWTIRAGKDWLERNGYITRNGLLPSQLKPLVLWSLRRAAA
jgi:hypothetical protein